MHYSIILSSLRDFYQFRKSSGLRESRRDESIIAKTQESKRTPKGEMIIENPEGMKVL